MSVLFHLEPKQVFGYFEQISGIHRGSGDRAAIADFCVRFADEQGLRFQRDEAHNVVIFKPATPGYEAAPPVILQGHLDMVCQKTPERDIDFLTQGLELYTDGDYVKARGTTLGADNGIAVAMVLAILAATDIPHPALEAVFTADEEVGMLGAVALDTSPLQGRRMINLDSEEMDCVTVSCAGGSDLTAALPLPREAAEGTEVTVTLKGLRGGHSGICIHEGRSNANKLAGELLTALYSQLPFRLLSADGGDKGNAIPPACTLRLCVADAKAFCTLAEFYLNARKEKLTAEPDFAFTVTAGETGTHAAATLAATKRFILCLHNVMDGVLTMSEAIPGLVETSLNLGILKTDGEQAIFNHALRSNRKAALTNMEAELTAYYCRLDAAVTTGGHYPPWEFNEQSVMLPLYQEAYREHFGQEPRVEAIHAGLECGVFADKLPGFDAIAIGPQIHDAHTVNERLSISSTAEIFALVCKILEKCR